MGMTPEQKKIYYKNWNLKNRERKRIFMAEQRKDPEYRRIERLKASLKKGSIKVPNIGNHKWKELERLERLKKQNRL